LNSLLLGLAKAMGTTVMGLAFALILPARISAKRNC
jgi:hypothetical protein